jgi:hypothetical protein
MHRGLDRVSLCDQTMDDYWKARVIEIRRPKNLKKKEEPVCHHAYMVVCIIHANLLPTK